MLKSIPRQRNNKSNEETEDEDSKDHDCVDLAVPKPAAASPLKRPHKPARDSICEHNKNRKDYKMLLYSVKKEDKNGRISCCETKVVYVSTYVYVQYNIHL